MTSIEEQLRTVLRMGIKHARDGETYGRCAAGYKIAKLLKDLEYSTRAKRDK